jgi:hypothetical protein
MDPEAPSPLSTENSQTARILRWTISIITLMISGYMEWWLMLHGKSDNMLHQNAQFYGFVMITGILMGLGIGETLGDLAKALKK